MSLQWIFNDTVWWTCIPCTVFGPVIQVFEFQMKLYEKKNNKNFYGQILWKILKEHIFFNKNQQHLTNKHNLSVQQYLIILTGIDACATKSSDKWNL